MAFGISCRRKKEKSIKTYLLYYAIFFASVWMLGYIYGLAGG